MPEVTAKRNSLNRDKSVKQVTHCTSSKSQHATHFLIVSLHLRIKI